MAGTVPLAEFARSETDLKRLSIIQDFRKNIQVMEYIPWETTGKLATVMTKWQTVPTPTYKKLNEAFDSIKGDTSNVTESVAFMGFYIDVDKRIAMARNGIENERAKQQKMAMHAKGCRWNYNFINGDQTSDPDVTNGLKYRLANDSNIPDANKISADSATSGGLDVLASAANQHKFIDKLEQMLSELPGGDDTSNVMIFCNNRVIRALDSINRRLGLFPMTAWAFGRRVRTFGEGGPPFIDMGYSEDDSTLVIPNTDTATGGGSAQCTTIYAGRIEEDYLWGQQEYPVDVIDKGLLEDGITFRLVVDWPHTLAMGHKRSIAKTYDLYFSNS